MRKFSSYGPVNTKLHYYAPRKELIDRALFQLTGEIPEEGGHYVTVWAPRQTGKTWIMQQVMQRISGQGEFETGIISMQSAKTIDSDRSILKAFVRMLKEWFERDFPEIDSWDMLHCLFKRPYFSRPVILIIDEFDALKEDFINGFANAFRDMYIGRQNEAHRSTGEKNCLLHGLSLIGVRNVLGIENVSGSPFNVQRSLRIPNLTFEEVRGMFQWFEKDSGRKVEPEATERLFYETQGQPGLTCWFGELLTEGFDDYRPAHTRPVSVHEFDYVFRMAVKALPNNNILNIISKASQAPYQTIVLDLFKTTEKQEFAFDDASLNFLFMNGVIATELTSDNLYVKFSSPFVQKRLFNYFARELFGYTGKLHQPFEDLSDAVIETSLNVKNLMRRFERYLKQNREWLLSDAPRRKDMRIFEAVYHFILYRYVYDFLKSRRARVWPEFPAGNGKADIMIQYAGVQYALEIKSYTDAAGYDDAVTQAARYAKQLDLPKIALIFFVDSIDDANRTKYENDIIDETAGILVQPVFVETGDT